MSASSLMTSSRVGFLTLALGKYLFLERTQPRKTVMVKLVRTTWRIQVMWGLIPLLISRMRRFSEGQGLAGISLPVFTPGPMPLPSL